MFTIKRTNSNDVDFQKLVRELDLDLQIRDGADHSFYAQFNKIAAIQHVVLAYDQNEAVGCGAIKEYSPEAMEVKRMFVPANRRGQGIAGRILSELENWSRELGYTRCILETGKKQPEAIRLYTKTNYQIIPNYGQYTNVENSICFAKELSTPFILTPDIRRLNGKILLGMHCTMSFDQNLTPDLWRRFMPRRKEIKQVANTELFSVEVYDPLYFQNFNPARVFEKWAAVEVIHTDDIPEGMEILDIPSGPYAVFLHHGPASEGPKTYEYIFKTWLPQSAYSLDHRPHFAVMGEKYKRDDPVSKEEIWIPIRPK